MASVEHIENALQRLAPAALSLRASRSIEQMLDELAGQTVDDRPPAASLHDQNPSGIRRRWFGFGAAAAVAIGTLAALCFWPDHLEQSPPPLAAQPPQDHAFELIREVNRVESAVDEGTVADEAGGMHRVLRYRVVGESIVRGASGEVVRVVEPRDEVVLVPVSSF